MIAMVVTLLSATTFLGFVFSLTAHLTRAAWAGDIAALSWILSAIVLGIGIILLAMGSLPAETISSDDLICVPAVLGICTFFVLAIALLFTNDKSILADALISGGSAIVGTIAGLAYLGITGNLTTRGK